MTDEELCKALRSALWGQGHHINIKAADRIEQLVASNEYLNSRLENVLSREAETYAEHKEQLEALTAERDDHWKSFVHWRKEADDRAEQLEAARADAKEAEAYAEELAGDQVDLCRQLIAAEAKLAKAVECLNYCINAPFSGCTIAQGYARATLAEIEGKKDE